MTIPCAGETIDVALPNWSPGYYLLENNGEKVSNVMARGNDGKTLEVTKPAPDIWHIDTLGAQSITVTYSRQFTRQSGPIGMFSSDADTIHYGGPSVYMYVVGRKKTACVAEFRLPRESGIAVSLAPIGNNQFSAEDYDELADAPVTMGRFRTSKYVSRGKEHTIAVRGPARDLLDLPRATRMMQFITESGTDFFGKAAPYARYVWHVWAADTGDGAGGLEHASSSQDFMSITQGPATIRGLTHEYFHLWNVKRIRSESLGPFDYRAVPRTGALWWLEGVTDYYASVIPHRYGWYGDEEFLADVAANVQSVISNQQRMVVSPFEGSFRVGEASGGRGNSRGFGVNYYPTGWVLGMLFDIELRAASQGKRSLDDVELALWRLCRDGKPGFEEGELRRQLLRVGGPAFGPLYDAWVMRPGELPIEATLAKVGLELIISGKSHGIRPRRGATSTEVWLRENWFWGKRKRPISLVGDL